MRGRSVLKCVIAVLCGVLAACAIITVNVYFPEKDVKQAYKSLDDMLLKEGSEGSSPEANQPPGATEQKDRVKPQSGLFNWRFSFSFVGVANAAEPVADQLAIEISNNNDVIKAYEGMKQRLAQLNALRDSGVIGESKQGLVSVRDKGRVGGAQPMVDAENRDRKTVITAMAKAILKLNKQQESPAAMNQVLGKAAATFATTRQEEAKPGWWIELQNGRWVQK